MWQTKCKQTIDSISAVWLEQINTLKSIEYGRVFFCQHVLRYPERILYFVVTLDIVHDTRAFYLSKELHIFFIFSYLLPCILKGTRKKNNDMEIASIYRSQNRAERESEQNRKLKIKWNALIWCETWNGMLLRTVTHRRAHKTCMFGKRAKQQVWKEGKQRHGLMVWKNIKMAN